MNPKYLPYLKNLRIALITACAVVLCFGVTDIVKNRTSTIEVVAMLVLVFNLVYLIGVPPKLPPPTV